MLSSKRFFFQYFDLFWHEVQIQLKDVLLTLRHAVYINELGCLSYQIWEYKTKQDEVAFVLVEK